MASTCCTFGARAVEQRHYEKTLRARRRQPPRDDGDLRGELTRRQQDERLHRLLRLERGKQREHVRERLAAARLRLNNRVAALEDGGQRVGLDGRGFIETESGGALEEPWRQVGGVCVGESF